MLFGAFALAEAVTAALHMQSKMVKDETSLAGVQSVFDLPGIALCWCLIGWLKIVAHVYNSSSCYFYMLAVT